MNFDDEKPKASKKDLLNELESIQELLIEEPGKANNEFLEFEDLEESESLFSPESNLDPDVGLDLDLDLEKDLELDIPILDDIVDQDKAPQYEKEDKPLKSGLLDLDDIFENSPTSLTVADTLNSIDENLITSESLPAESVTGGIKHEGKPDLNIDFLIQELVDEFIPVIEDQLRERLSKIQPDIILDMADKYLKS